MGYHNSYSNTGCIAKRLFDLIVRTLDLIGFPPPNVREQNASVPACCMYLEDLEDENGLLLVLCLCFMLVFYLGCDRRRSRLSGAPLHMT